MATNCLKQLFILLTLQILFCSIQAYASKATSAGYVDMPILNDAGIQLKCGDDIWQSNRVCRFKHENSCKFSTGITFKSCVLSLKKEKVKNALKAALDKMSKQEKEIYLKKYPKIKKILTIKDNN